MKIGTKMVGGKGRVDEVIVWLVILMLHNGGLVPKVFSYSTWSSSQSSVYPAEHCAPPAVVPQTVTRVAKMIRQNKIKSCFF